MQNAININITVLFFIKAPFCYSACLSVIQLVQYSRNNQSCHIFSFPLCFLVFYSSDIFHFLKNTAIYMGFPIHMTVFPCVRQLTYLANCLIPAGCLGWCRQYIHLLPAAAFTELRATFSKIVAVIFFFLLPGI